ncbi:MAG: hypothetical protein ACK4RS_00185 [Thiothrix sp.]
MAKIVFTHNLSTDFTLNTGTQKVDLNLDGTTIVRDSATGKLKVDPNAIGAGVSADAGNLLKVGGDGKPKLLPDADFVEAVQDAVGQGILANSGLTYDDAANAIRAAVGNMTVGDTDTIDMTMTGTNAVITAELRIDPNTNNLLTKSAAGAAVMKPAVLSAVEAAITVSGFIIDTTANQLQSTVTVNGVNKTMTRALEPVEDAFGTPMNMWMLK